ncbi:MAG TPA: hypothetical protein VFJ74_07995 [Gemmatimonadaceae bacterium]|nr:hypothetical protein [Gemmatimonadaceae bacterium]
MRRTNARRILTVAATIVATTAAAGACARMGAGSASGGGGGGGGESSYRADVALRPDSTLRIARTQLEHHNYKVSDAGPNAIVTLPAPIPAYLQDKSGATKERYWVLRVSADPQSLGSGSRLTVTGYLLPPPAARAAGAAAPPPAGAIPVTSANRALFGEVRAAGKWIQDEAWRNRKRKK